MDIYVINLVSQTGRRQFMQEQFDARDKASKDAYRVIFFNAIDAKRGEHLAFKQYNLFRSVLFRGKALSDGERACFASHYRLWEICVAEDKPIVVIEDDVEILPRFYAELERIAQSEYVYVRLMYSKANAKLLPLANDFYISFDSIAGTQGYYLTPFAAKAFIESAKVWFRPVDDYMDMFYVHHIPAVCVKPALREQHNLATTIDDRQNKVVWYLRIIREISRIYFQCKKQLYLCFRKKHLALPKDALHSLGGGYIVLEREKKSVLKKCI